MQSMMKKFTIMLICIPSALMVALLTPIANLILEEYSQYPVALVTMIQTVPNLSVMVGLILAPILVKKISAKVLVLAGLLIYSVSGFLPVVVTGFYAVLLLRVLTGIGCGLLLPLQATFAAAYPEKERASIMGLTVTVSCLGAAGLVVVAGIMAASGWRNVFWLYLACMIPFVLSLIFLPSNPEVAEAEGAEAQSATGSGKSITDFMPILVVYYVILIASYLCVTILGPELAPYLASTGLGDATVSGLLMSFSMVGSLLSGIVMGAYLNTLKTLSMPSVFLFSAIGCALMWIAPNIPVVGAGVFIIGFFSAMVVAAINYELSLVLPLDVFTTSSAITNLFTFVLQFIAPLVFLAILNMVGGSFRGVFLVYTVFLAVMVVVSYILTKGFKKNA